jgi:hypothetical protein
MAQAVAVVGSAKTSTAERKPRAPRRDVRTSPPAVVGNSPLSLCSSARNRPTGEIVDDHLELSPGGADESSAQVPCSGHL